MAVRAGEVLGVFGRNGVGKTTLLKTIAGWIRASRGEIRFDGMRIDGAAPDRICRLGVGFVPEDRRIFPGLTVEENLTLGFMQVPRRGGAANRAALADIYRRFPACTSAGASTAPRCRAASSRCSRSRACWSASRACSWSTSRAKGLAPMMVSEIYAILSELKRAGRAILLVEQNVAQALTLCDRFVAMERGRLTLAGDARDAADGERLMAAITV